MYKKTPTASPYSQAIRALLMLAVAVLLPQTATAADDTLATEPINYNDGPHVYMRSDTSAIVFYLCENELDTVTVFFTDTLRFTGRCGDSGQSYAIPAHIKADDSCSFMGVPKELAVSDLHGDFAPFVDILIKGGVIDSSRQWIFGTGHLVVNGDVFDRGDKVTECLWLIHQLQLKAPAHGGRVHFTLGNHEAMVLRADNRYIHEKYLDGISKKSRIRHEDLYGPDMVLGRWLRTLPAVVVINDILFVHAGISPELIENDHDAARLNDEMHRAIDLTSAATAFDTKAKLLLGSFGPVWYRGFHYAMEDRYPQATSEDIDKLLTYYGVSTIVVGHSQVDEVMPLYGGRVYAIDVRVEALGYQQALLWEDGDFYRIDGDGTRQLLSQ